MAIAVDLLPGYLRKLQIKLVTNQSIKFIFDYQKGKMPIKLVTGLFIVAIVHRLIYLTFNI